MVNINFDWRELLRDFSIGLISAIIAGFIVLLIIYYYDKYTKRMFVYFYKPTCPYCIEFDPTWDLFAQGKNAHKVNALTPHGQALAQKYQVKGYPTVMAFDRDRNQHVFGGTRTIQNLEDFAASI